MTKFIVFLTLGFWLTQCRTIEPSSEKEALPSEERTFLSNLNVYDKTYAHLPLKAEHKGALWNGYYWPYSQGSIKAKPFGASESPFAKIKKIYYMRHMKEAFDSQFEPWLDRVINFNKEESWSGICTGVAKASFSVKVPTVPVTLDGVTFYPHEIKALFALFFNFTENKSYIAGERAEWQDDVLDDTGRPRAPATRDTNPGTFHIAMTELLSRQVPFFVDVSNREPVLNFPVKKFEVLSSLPLTDKAKIESLRNFNRDAVSWMQVKARLTMADSHRVILEVPGRNYDYVQEYDYILELDGEGKIIGGEWQGESQMQHPDLIATGQFMESEWQKKDLTGPGGKVLLPQFGAFLDELMKAPPSSEKMSELKEENPDYNLGFKLVGEVLPKDAKILNQVEQAHATH